MKGPAGLGIPEEQFNASNIPGIILIDGKLYVGSVTDEATGIDEHNRFVANAGEHASFPPALGVEMYKDIIRRGGSFH